MARKISQHGVDFIKSFEGCSLKAYKVSSAEKYYTIGYGHYGSDVKKDMVITKEYAEEMLKQDLVKYEKYVNSKTNVPFTNELTQNMFDALVSFCYNCGSGALKKACSSGIENVCDYMQKIIHCGGVVLAGLVRRRKQEIELFNKAEVSFPKSSYTLVEERTVYSQPKGDSEKLKHGQLTTTQQKNQDKDGDGRLDAGSVVTNKGTVDYLGNVYMKTYSGYIQIYSRKQQKAFVK